MMVLARCYGMAKLGMLYLLHRRVAPADFGVEYDRVSATYGRWLARMARHTDLLLDDGELPAHPRILDLACGTGYLTRRLLERHADLRPAITAVDISGEMIARCRAEIADPRVSFITADGLSWLADAPPASLDAIYCGWGLVYFPHRRLLPLCRRALAPGGIMGAIMNCRGTLAGIEGIIVEAMTEHPAEVHKVMDLGRRLPAGTEDFARRFTAAGFRPVRTGGGEEVVAFESAEALYGWLCETGALAGLGQLFRDPAVMAPTIIGKIAERRGQDGACRVNHKFLYGIFQRR